MPTDVSFSDSRWNFSQQELERTYQCRAKLRTQCVFCVFLNSKEYHRIDDSMTVTKYQGSVTIFSDCHYSITVTIYWVHIWVASMTLKQL